MAFIVVARSSLGPLSQRQTLVANPNRASEPDMEQFALVDFGFRESLPPIYCNLRERFARIRALAL